MTHPQKRRAPLPSNWYWGNDQLEQERKSVFSKNWIFAGMAQELENHNDYVSFTIAGIPVIVRNTRGKLTAFYNVCSHRHSIIHPVGHGNAPFRCSFHGWTYDAEGIPVSIPDNTRAFGFDKEDRCALALRRIDVESCGQFVFVRLDKEGLALREWLGPFAVQLENISAHYNKIYDRLDLVWASNWKFGIEITLEGYHLPFVHPASFSQYIDSVNPRPAATPESDADHSPYGRTAYAGPHISNISALSSAAVEETGKIADRLQLPSTQKGSHEHFLIYPNFMIGISSGTLLCAERYEPRAPDRTEVKCWLMTGVSKDAAIYDSPVWKTACQRLREWTLSVMGEDQSACETTQAGVRYAEGSGFLGEIEERVRHFQSTLVQDVH